MSEIVWRVVEVTQDEGGELRWELLGNRSRVAQDGEPYGYITAVESAGDFNGRKLLVGGRVHVHPDFRRRGLATKLYAVAAVAAVERDRVFASVKREADDEAIQAFWAKQLAAERAKSVSRPHGIDVLLLTGEPV